MRHLAMYNGHGCADVALANLGLIPEVTFSTEIDARACMIANYRHPHTVQLGDAFEADYGEDGLYLKFSSTTSLYGSTGPYTSSVDT